MSNYTEYTANLPMCTRVKYRPQIILFTINVVSKTCYKLYSCTIVKYLLSLLSEKQLFLLIKYVLMIIISTARFGQTWRITVIRMRSCHKFEIMLHTYLCHYFKYIDYLSVTIIIIQLHQKKDINTRKR